MSQPKPDWHDFIKAQNNFIGPPAPLTIELLESAWIASLKAAEAPVPCIACGTPTVDCGRWVGVYQKGLGPACVKCYNEAQENMLTEAE